MPQAMTREMAEETVRIFNQCDNNLQATCLALNISQSAFNYRKKTITRRFPDIVFPDTAPEPHGKALSPEELQAAVDAFALAGGKQVRAAEALGLEEGVFRYRLNVATMQGYVATPRGAIDAMKAAPASLPKKGTIKRYIVTCAQSGTLLHEPTWDALTTLARHYGAELFVSTLTYMHSQEGSAKRDTAKSDKGDWYDPRIEPFVRDEMIELAPGLVWNGHTNILPTAIDPLSGWENYNFRASSIFPHVKCAMKSVPTVRADAAKLQYTTGTVTQRNYLQKKAGQRAEFDHVYGGLIVEVNSEGDWWVRQLNVDTDGYLYDLDVRVQPEGRVVPVDGVEAIQFGDVHVAQLESPMVFATWGKGGMVDALKPRYQFMHDILDFESRSHHNLRDPFKMYELHVKGRDSVEMEIRGVASLLNYAARPGCELVIVQSNHDLHFERWLREGTWKTDPRNALLHSRATTAFLEAINDGEHFNALKWALDTYCPVPDLVWADPDEGFVILKDHTGGIEMGLHGDLGPNGSRGSIRNLARLGRKVCIGHSHSAGIFNGAYQSGVKAKLGMDYARGAPSSWTQSDIVVFPNGKRQVITWWKGRYRA